MSANKHTDQSIDPIGKPPSVNPVHRTHAKDSHPKPANDNALTPSRTRMSSPLAIAREQRRTRSNKLPRRNATATCARAMGQDYPSTGPSPGANPPIYPSSLPLACGNLLSNIFSKSHGFFSFQYVYTVDYKSMIGGYRTLLVMNSVNPLLIPLRYLNHV